jgi:hypothetical protein
MRPLHRRRELELFDLQREAREPCDDGAVELELVLLGGLLGHRRGEGVAQLREPLGSRLDEVEVLPVALLGFLAPGGVVGPLGRLAVGNQLRLLVLEQVELAPDDVLEGQRSSR